MVLVAPAWDEAWRAAHEAGRVLPSHVVPVSHGDRRVLAAEIRARTPLPPRHASAMDGWAVCGVGPWRVVDDVLAGQDRLTRLRAGQAVAIATGAAVPPDTSGVLRSERGTVDAAGFLHGAIGDGTDIRPAGEEADLAELLIPAGTVLTPAHLGLAAAGGHDELAVVRRPRATFLVLGDELLRTGQAREGKIRDSLGAQVPAWLERMGFEVTCVAWVPDTRDAHVQALLDGADADVIVTSGGTAQGPVDFLRVALADTGGELVIDRVDVRPGSPMILGRWPGRRWLIGLPGNPQAAIVALMTLGLPLADALHGRPLAELDTRQLAASITSRGSRTRLVPCTDMAGIASPADFIGSGMLRGLADSTGFAVVVGGQGEVGGTVRWLPLP
jgi:molybdopterin molybdotransferase